ncbi:hypothetical protein V1505DRAFT_366432 [Lipomyces doorenjongii]
MDLLDYILAHPLFPARRLPSLFADFRRLKDSNPDGYDANIAAWQKALTQAVREGGPRYWKGGVKSVDDQAASNAGGADGIDDVLIIHSGRKLQDSLTSREWGKPLGLSAVIEEQVAKRAFVPVDTFLNEKFSLYKDSNWQIIKYGTSMLGWMFRDSFIHEYYQSIMSWRRDGELPKIDFVILENLEEAGKILLSRVKKARKVGMSVSSEKFNAVFTLAMLKDLYCNDPFGVADAGGVDLDKMASNTPSLSDFDFRILIRYLTRDSQQATVDGNIIKFKETSEILTLITEEDRTVAELRHMIMILSKRIASQHLQAITSRRKAGEFVSERPSTDHLRSLARNELKKAKLAESIVQKSMEYKLQMETLLENIENAHSNLEISKIMESSLPVLEQLNMRIGGIDKVSDIVDRLREQREETEGIGRALGEVSAGEVDDDEIVHEFDRMLQEETRKADKTKLEKPVVSGDDLAVLLSKASLEEVPSLEPMRKASTKQAFTEGL